MFFVNPLELNRHGYYQVNGFRTYSKFEAWTLSGGDMSQIEFVYNYDIMDQYDWAVEPTEDIHDLYRERAQQIRHEYDYLVLMYSGGVDSHVALESFLGNGIHLDEVLTCSNADREVKTGKLNQEVFKKAIPYVQSRGLDQLKTKFRYVEIGDLIVNQWSDEFHYENFHHYHYGPQWLVIRSHKLKQMIPEHMRLAEQGRKICYIWGLEKPSVFLRNNRWCYKFADTMVNFNGREFINQVVLADRFKNFYDETFYLSRHSPKIPIKQCHLLVKKLRTISPDSPGLHCVSDLANTGPAVVHHKKMPQPGAEPLSEYRFLPRYEVAATIYPQIDVYQFGDDKVKGSVIFSRRDYWFSQSEHTNRYRYQDKVDNLVLNNRKYFISGSDGLAISPATCFSKPYVISEIPPEFRHD